MQIEQRFELPVPPERAWPAFRNIELLVDCLPGASLTGPPVNGEVPLRFDVKLGPIAAGFAGTGTATFDDAARSGRFEGAATDRKTNSRVKGAADFVMTASGAGSAVSLNVDYALSGSLAQFGRGGIVRELANALTAQFASHLAARLTDDTAVSPPIEPVPSEATLEPAETVSPVAAMGDATPAVTTATAPAPAPVAPVTRPSIAVSRPAAAQPLSAGSLLVSVLRARLSTMARRLAFWRSH